MQFQLEERTENWNLKLMELKLIFINIIKFTNYNSCRL